jgi:hypothetical protein
MKTIKVELLKRNRKYFAAKFESGCPVKILIDDASEKLELGMRELVTEDISVRSKYGTDLIYRVIGEQKKEDGVCTLKHPRFNRVLVVMCKNLGGRWDDEAKAWVFSSIVAAEVEELDYVYNSKEIPIQITAKQSIGAGHDSVYFLGYPVARAMGRDSGATLGEGVSLISGKIDSGGSVKNWTTEIAEGTVLRLMVPEVLLDEVLEGVKQAENPPAHRWEIVKL